MSPVNTDNLTRNSPTPKNTSHHSKEMSKEAISCPRTPHPVEKIKTLPPSVVKDIEQKNIARRLAGLSHIAIKVRRCILCGSSFESAGNRTCGCSSRTAGTIAGREII